MATPAVSGATRRSHAASDDVLACKECLRRKAHCDHKIPECTTCKRYKRHCLYDRHGRTRLTRRNLTEVEHRLDRAETILKRLFTDEEVSYLLDQERSGQVPVLPPIKSRSATPRNESPAGPSVHSPTRPQSGGQVTPQAQEPPHPNASAGDPESTWSYPDTDTDPDLAAILYPDLNEEFEWDEREQASSYLALNGGVATTDDDDEEAKLTDGMGNLDITGHGYLGMASGASHLSSLWMETGSGTTWDPNSWNERRRRLRELLRRQSKANSVASAVQAQPLVTKTMLDSFVDAFFIRYHPNFPILHEPTFRAQYANTFPRPSPGNWLVLVNIVAALGAFVTSPDPADDTDISIFRTAKRFLSVNTLEAGNLTLVQAFGLSANYLQKRNKPNTGYNYGGLALRMAIGLGLHKELGSQRMTPYKQELRRRVWWALCVLDVGATITYSRPLIWPREGVDAHLPSNIREEDLMVQSPTMPAEVEQVTANTYIRVQSSYHIQTMKIYNRLISNSPPAADELLALDSGVIETWLRQIPHYFHDNSGPTVNDRYALVHGINSWRYRNLRIIMFRPLLVRWALQKEEEDTLTWPEQEATNRCLRAARESITLISGFWKTRSQTRLTAFYVLYFLFQAVLIPIHCLRSRTASRLVPEWRNQITSALEVVESMTNMNPSGSKCRDVILSLCGSLLRTIGDDFIIYEQATMFEQPMMDATAWMAGCAPTLINENLWAGSLDNTSNELNFSNWEGDWNH